MGRPIACSPTSYKKEYHPATHLLRPAHTRASTHTSLWILMAELRLTPHQVPEFSVTIKCRRAAAACPHPISTHVDGIGILPVVYISFHLRSITLINFQPPDTDQPLTPNHTIFLLFQLDLTLPLCQALWESVNKITRERARSHALTLLINDSRLSLINQAISAQINWQINFKCVRAPRAYGTREKYFLTT